MSDKLCFTDHNKDPKAEFQAAVDTINAFNQQNEFASPFSSLIRLVADRLIGNKQEALLKRAVQTLKRNYALISKLEKGSVEEQTLASFARNVISLFNANIDKVVANNNQTVKERIAAFLIAKSILSEIGRIDLPQDSTIHYSSSIQSPYAAASSEKISKLPQIHPNTSPLPKQQVPFLSGQAVQLFYMKVISLIEKHKILSHLEARHVIRNAILHTTLNNELNVCIATCEISPFPGQTIIVKGVFDKDPKSSIYNIPSKKYPFHLAKTSRQGFPHPSQLGWALPDMIPEYFQRINELDEFQNFYQNKLLLSKALNHNEKLLEKAKALLEEKRQAFNHSKDRMIDCHLTLSLKLAQEDGETNVEIIRAFYARLKQIHQPYDYLSNTYHLLNELYFKRCYEALQNAWFEGQLLNHQIETCQEILQHESQKIHAELQEQKNHANSEMEKCTLDFVLLMGEKLLPCHEIILQQFSEIVPFVVSELSLQAQKFQMICFRQFLSFEKELQTELADPLQKLEEDLEADIAILKSNSIDDLIYFQFVKELKHYYSNK